MAYRARPACGSRRTYGRPADLGRTHMTQTPPVATTTSQSKDAVVAVAQSRIRSILESWAQATRLGRQDDVLSSHAPSVLIDDVLPPMKYMSAYAYRRSWDDWQPETQGESRFELEDLSVTAGPDIAFTHGFIQCGGTLPSGRTFQDADRATSCLRKVDGDWKVYHQHLSKPLRPS